MQLTIIPIDNIVVVDGRPMTVDCTKFEPLRGVHAVQWQDDHGHIEYVNPPGIHPDDWRGNTPIADISVFDPVITAWQSAAALESARIAAAKEQIENAPRPIDGAAFLARLTDDELLAIDAAATADPQLNRWIKIAMMRGAIDIKGAMALAAKAKLVAVGLLSAERAQEIFQ